LPQLQWSTFDASILHGYRYDYRLNTPAAFNKPYDQLVLSRSAIGRMSPTMARRKEQRRQSKEQLANSVRKHFNSMGIIENEVVVDFLYKVRWQGMLIEGMWSVVCRVLIVHQIRISECDLLLSDLDDECIGFVSSIYRLRRFGAGLALYWFRRMVDTQFPTMIRRSGFGSSSKHFIGLSRYLRGNAGFSLWFERDVGDLGPRKGDTRIRPHQSDGSFD